MVAELSVIHFFSVDNLSSSCDPFDKCHLDTLKLVNKNREKNPPQSPSVPLSPLSPPQSPSVPLSPLSPLFPLSPISPHQST